MKATDYFKRKVESGEMTSEEALKQVLDLFAVSGSFIDTLIEKYTEQKKLALKNAQQFKDHPKYEWYDATFNNTLLFLWDLEDIKCRSGMSDD